MTEPAARRLWERCGQPRQAPSVRIRKSFQRPTGAQTAAACSFSDVGLRAGLFAARTDHAGCRTARPFTSRSFSICRILKRARARAGTANVKHALGRSDGYAGLSVGVRWLRGAVGRRRGALSSRVSISYFEAPQPMLRDPIRRLPCEGLEFDPAPPPCR